MMLIGDEPQSYPSYRDRPMNGQRLSDQFPGGCFMGFNAPIDRKAAEQLASVCGPSPVPGEVKASWRFHAEL